MRYALILVLLSGCGFLAKHKGKPAPATVCTQQGQVIVCNK